MRAQARFLCDWQSTDRPPLWFWFSAWWCSLFVLWWWALWESGKRGFIAFSTFPSGQVLLSFLLLFSLRITLVSAGFSTATLPRRAGRRWRLAVFDRGGRPCASHAAGSSSP